MQRKTQVSAIIIGDSVTRYASVHHPVRSIQTKASQGNTPRCQRLTGQDLWTKRILTLDFGIRRSITWQFTVADVSRPVIGADLLRHHGFIVDIQGKRLIDKLTQLNVPGFKRQIAYASIKTIDSTSTYYHILVDYPRITKEPQLPANRAHGIFHHIPTEDPPVASRKLRKRTFDAARDMLIFQ
ncbi:hypothetical protein ALC56_03936 [Trachymyrmex septentrionalis]|uniref:Uncharacterized protein n=1 Tax=Trachymyrmex septentrionalis TaxID=34720 RepID=A0A151JZ95_9HYME|nr:hypothetical protein ALC56_03936 [Trachymyrmex septentrionalis]